MFREKIFISYRRNEHPHEAARIAKILRRILPYGKVFFDNNSINSGSYFPEELNKAIQQSALVIVVIGEDWATMRDLNNNVRIKNEDDFVRIEVSRALAEEKIVVPVLFNGAEMPNNNLLPTDLKALSFKQALSTHNEGLEIAIGRLIRDHKIGIVDSSDLQNEIEKYYIITEWEPNFSRKKVNISAYKYLPPYEDIIGIIDFTTIGNAKHYMAFSNAGIYHRNIGTRGDCSFKAYAKIDKITFDARHETIFFDNEAWSLVGTMPGKAFELVQKILCMQNKLSN